MARAEGYCRLPAYTGMVDALCTIERTEGWAGLFSGVTVSVVKAAVASALLFFVYEATRDCLRRVPALCV